MLSEKEINSLILNPCVLTNPKYKAFENIVGKGENAGNQHFLIFPTMFSTLSMTEIIIFATIHLSFASALLLLSIWTSLNWCCLVKS